DRPALDYPGPWNLLDGDGLLRRDAGTYTAAGDRRVQEGQRGEVTVAGTYARVHCLEAKRATIRLEGNGHQLSQAHCGTAALPKAWSLQRSDQRAPLFRASSHQYLCGAYARERRFPPSEPWRERRGESAARCPAFATGCLESARPLAF